MAHTTITGTLGKDPELRQSRDGRTTFAKFSLAWSERQKDGAGQFIDGPTVWVQVTVFGRQAENAAQTLTKGMRAHVTGNLRPELWQSNQGEDTVMVMTGEKVAPDLTFATAQVVKIPKGGQQGGNFGGQQGDPWDSAPPARDFGNGGFGGAQDEEPPF